MGNGCTLTFAPPGIGLEQQSAARAAGRCPAFSIRIAAPWVPW